ncbi:hypothetical protein KAFR_0C05760 [Kazachstania africana CBS 2517]|uniref:serine--tRNA ligase n=1 Tax=Kazachstania africana (strain ATCC 22294 / BCRC 22015 / CBS 2517 / CECT 1963 / NBRC 1671 / NRRL Y-8276) TaxID=1071382 RepID=H2AT67_KAZAF|nr:hypothetical protein KAFR_0C05760 [Kazachstania africana CBS 2517]CCF57567.1 hypothetical protein KAFR_0C05760 [Kazachstania africana CBS 2517]
MLNAKRQLTFYRALSAGVKHYSFLKKPQLDVKFIIANLDKFEESIKKRELIQAPHLLNKLHELPLFYDRLRQIKQQINDIQKVRNQLESEVKNDKNRLPTLLQEIQKLKAQHKEKSEQLTRVSTEIAEITTSLPNILHPSVPATTPQIVQWLNRQQSSFLRNSESHVDIMTRKGMLDLQKAANTSGTSSYYLMNDGARLEQALINYCIDVVTKHGFAYVIPPSLTRLETIDSCGFRPRDMNGEKQIYSVGNEFGLVATSEITLAAFYANESITFKKNEYVKKIAGLSRCYRAEAGARGKDTKGLYRVHEFSKLEMFCWSIPDYADDVLELLKDIQIEIIQSLGLYAKVINMPANDLGNPASKKYDIEVWMPGRGQFGEVSSASNCTDFQSRRLNTKFRNEEKNYSYVYTLNGTAVAIPRIIIAIIENFYDANSGKIHIPSCLRKYMADREYI